MSVEEMLEDIERKAARHACASAHRMAAAIRSVLAIDEDGSARARIEEVLGS